jgi:quinohemoprotein ethanol dehydrogenase
MYFVGLPTPVKLFSQLVGNGAFLAKGMPNFDDRLNEQQINNMKRYVLSTAQWLIENK